MEISLTYQSVHVEDILSLQEELNLHPTALEAAYLSRSLQTRLATSVCLTQGDNLKDFAQEIGAHPESIAALYRKLKTIERFRF